MANFHSAGEEGSPRAHTYEVIFGHDTPAGKAFDVLLIILIMASVATVMLESLQSWRTDHALLLRTLEWVFTGMFTVEYGLRLWCVNRPRAYALSFFGVIDFLSILPTYLSVIFSGTQSLLIIRIFRLLRMPPIHYIRIFLCRIQ